MLDFAIKHVSGQKCIRKHAFAIQDYRLKQHVGGIKERLKLRHDPFYRKISYLFTIAI